MPTGTGKADTMISILVSAICPKLLVIVPTDARVLTDNAKFPVVGMVQHIPQTVAEVDEIFSRCQVIITTSSIAGQCERAIQDRMAHHCP